MKNKEKQLLTIRAERVARWFGQIYRMSVSLMVNNWRFRFKNWCSLF